jgi:hypothetical protein
LHFDGRTQRAGPVQGLIGQRHEDDRKSYVKQKPRGLSKPLKNGTMKGSIIVVAGREQEGKGAKPIGASCS